MQTFNNDELGVAVMVEPISGGYGGHKLTLVSYDADVPNSNNVVGTRTYPAGKLSDAIEYAKLCVKG